jgi:hypothetical protein
MGVGLRLLVGLILLESCRHQNKCYRCEYKEKVFHAFFPNMKRIDAKSGAAIISLQTVDSLRTLVKRIPSF